MVSCRSLIKGDFHLQGYRQSARLFEHSQLILITPYFHRCSLRLRPSKLEAIAFLRLLDASTKGRRTAA